MKIFRILTMAVLIWFFVVSHITIYDDEIRALGEPLSIIAVYSSVVFVWYVAMKKFVFGFLLTPRQSKVK